MPRRFPFHRAVHGLTGALCLILLACSGGDSTGPDNDPPIGPGNPGPGDPGPGDPGPTQPGIVAGTYALTFTNGSEPGLLVTVSNPDGKVIGLYRFQATTTLTLDPLGGYSLSIQYSDDKGDFALADEGEYKWASATGGVLLSFESDTFGDAFSGAAATNGAAMIRYDFDGDGQIDTVFEFQKVTGG